MSSTDRPVERPGQARRAACFHAQQCAEKAIKACLIFSGIPFRKVHDLELLCQELSESWTLSEGPERLSWLTVWAVEPRYPGDLPEATEDDARTAVRQAHEVLETAWKDLGDHGYAPGNGPEGRAGAGEKEDA